MQPAEVLCGSVLAPKHPTEPWEIPFQQFKDLVLRPGGDLLAFPPTKLTGQREFSTRQRSAYWNSLDGKAQAQVLDELRQDRGDFLRIKLMGQASAQFRVAFDPSGVDGKGQGVSENLSFSGVALWDSKHARLEGVRVELLSKTALVTDVRDAQTPGRWFRSEASVDGAGTCTLSCEYGFKSPDERR